MSKIENILNNYQNEILTYIDKDGDHNINIDEFVGTGSDNVLKNLNRTPDILLRVANANPDKLKWVNDYAMAQVIIYLYNIIDGLRSDIVSKDSEIERLNNENAASRVGIVTSDSIPKDEADKLIEINANLEADKKLLEHNIELQQNRIDELDATINELTKQNSVIATITQERDDLRTQLDKVNDALNNLSIDYTDLDNLHNKYVDDKEIKIKELLHQIESLNTHINNMKNNIDEATDKYNETLQRLSEMTIEYEKRGDLIEKLEKEYDDVCNVKIDIENELNATTNDLITLRDNFGEATDRIRNLDSTNAELQNELNQRNELIDDLQTNINDLNDTITNITNTLEEKTKTNALLESQVKTLTTEQTKIDNIETALETFLNEIGYNKNNDHNVSRSGDNTQHRMGDNCTVDFNIGM